MLGRWIAASAASLFSFALLSSMPSAAEEAYSTFGPASAKAERAESFVGRGDSTVRVELPPPDTSVAKSMRDRNAATMEKRLEIAFGRSLARLPGSSSDALEWESAPGGRAARWEVASPGAPAVRVGLEIASLPRGAQLRFAGSADPSHVHGPFAAEELLREPEYWSPVLEGERATVEVFVPDGDGAQELRVGLLWVSHFLAAPREADLERKLGESQSCEVDLICLSATSSPLAQVGRSVARMVFTVSGGGQALCTGTLLTTNAGAGAPYFYSANHCISTQSSASTLTTHWFYDRTTCNTGSGINPSYTQLSGGATLLYNNATSDALLLRLNSTPPAGAVYAGWNSTALTNGTPLVAVHHPAGDVKKVSLGSAGGFSAYGGGAGSTHIIALWNGTSTGVTEGGSSGSGIFTSVGSPVTTYQLRGGLHGGPSSCTASGTGLRDYYSRFDNAYPSLAQWLAPSGCTYTLSSNSASPSAAGGAASFTVTTQPGCAWAAVSNAAWITTSSFATGSGTVNYTVAPNTGAARSGTIVGFGPTFTVNQAAGTAAAPARLTNISTRMQVLTGNDVMIGGFVILGSTPKTVAIVATGPSLAPYGITNPLSDPMITLVRSSDQAVITSNDDWQGHASAAQLQASGFAPSNGLESGILVTLQPGAYTAIVSGFAGATGVAVVGVYEVDGPAIPLANISTRGRVLTGNDVMIGGFVIEGTGSQTVAIVATGPSLAAYGIANPLSDPVITLVRSSDQAVITSNDDWQTHANASQLQAAGFAPQNGLESGIYVTLQPGAYTAIVSGYLNATGVAVIGVYRVN
jgi:hypothetical protein